MSSFRRRSQLSSPDASDALPLALVSAIVPDVLLFAPLAVPPPPSLPSPDPPHSPYASCRRSPGGRLVHERLNRKKIDAPPPYRNRYCTPYLRYYMIATVKLPAPLPNISHRYHPAPLVVIAPSELPRRFTQSEPSYQIHHIRSRHFRTATLLLFRRELPRSIRTATSIQNRRTEPLRQSRTVVSDPPLQNRHIRTATSLLFRTATSYQSRQNRHVTEPSRQNSKLLPPTVTARSHRSRTAHVCRYRIAATVYAADMYTVSLPLYCLRLPFCCSETAPIHALHGSSA